MHKVTTLWEWKVTIDILYIIFIYIYILYTYLWCFYCTRGFPFPALTTRGVFLEQNSCHSTFSSLRFDDFLGDRKALQEPTWKLISTEMKSLRWDMIFHLLVGFDVVDSNYLINVMFFDWQGIFIFNIICHIYIYKYCITVYIHTTSFSIYI